MLWIQQKYEVVVRRDGFNDLFKALFQQQALWSKVSQRKQGSYNM